MTISENLQQAERHLLSQTIDPLVVLSDMNLPDGNALDLLERIKDKIVSSEWVF